MVLCRGSSVCNFHSGPGNFVFSGVSPWNFNFVIFWKQTLAFTCLGTRFPSNHLVFFSIFPCLRLMSACSTIITKEPQHQSSFQSPSDFGCFPLFSCVSPNLSPKYLLKQNQAKLQAINQSTTGMAAATDPSTTGRGQYLLPRPHRGGKMGISTAWIYLTPPMPPDCHL